MDKSDAPRVSKPYEFTKLDMLLYVARILSDKEFGPHEEDKEVETRIFKNTTIPRKKRSHRSHRSSYSPTAWMRLIDEDISKLENPSSESQPSSSSSSCVTQSKKSRHVNVSKEEEERRVFKKRKIVPRLVTNPTQTTPPPPPHLPPEWLLNVMMREGNGYNPKLISTRKLYQTDLNKIQARLSVPFKQVVTPDFLTEEETRIMDEQAITKTRKQGVIVDFVDPLMNKYVMELRKWKMSGNWYYVFVHNWNLVLAANSFIVNDVFHLWSFRSESGKLCFAQVPSPATNSSNAGGGASTSGESGHVNPLPQDSGHNASTSGGCSSIDDDSQNV